jgi:hypothetical protein
VPPLSSRPGFDDPRLADLPVIETFGLFACAGAVARLRLCFVHGAFR